MKRRVFLQAALGGAGLLLPRAKGSVQHVQVPLDARGIDKYADPLPTFCGARVSGTDLVVSAEEFDQQVLPAGYNKTKVWGYRVGTKAAPGTPLYPGFTIEAQRRLATRVTYVNALNSPPDLQSYITVDQSIHWANPAGLPMMDPARMLPYAGPPPLVAHLHGAEVPSEFDGGPEAWFTPDGVRGPAYRTSGKTARNAATYVYPNGQEATTLWFHDHTLGMTRLNVYCGLAAFYLLRDPEGMDTGVETEGGLPAGNREIEIVIQDRQFDTEGQLLFPDGNPQGLNGPPPNPALHPFWIPEFFGDAIVVNGKTWPYLDVQPCRYRFRFLNGSNARFYRMAFDDGPRFWVIGTDGGLLDAPVPAEDLLFAPGERYDIIIDFSRFAGKTLTLLNSAPAPFPDGDLPDPESNGQIMQFRVSDHSVSDSSYNPASGGPLRRRPIPRLVMPGAGRLAPEVKPDLTRQLVLVEVEGDGGPVEVLVNNTKWTGIREGTMKPVPGSKSDGYGNYLTELPRVGATEVWEIVNLTGDAHPIHLHLVQFQLINRQDFDEEAYSAVYESAFPGGVCIPGYGPPFPYMSERTRKLGGNPDVEPFLIGEPAPPLPHESGWKDTVIMRPGEVSRIAVRFAPQSVPVGATRAGRNLYAFDPTTGPGYVWHCHIIDHEDNEMMRPYNLRQ